MHTLKLIDLVNFTEYLHVTPNDTLQTLHFARTDMPYPFVFTTQQTIDLRPLLYHLPPLFTNLRDVQVADRVAVPGIEGANQVIGPWLQHWQKLNFTDIRIGVLYVNVDLSTQANRNALGLHMNGVLPEEHAYKVQLLHQQEHHRFYIQYIYTSEHINGTFTVQYTREEDEEEDEEMDEVEEEEESIDGEEEENGDIDEEQVL